MNFSASARLNGSTSVCSSVRIAFSISARWAAPAGVNAPTARERHPGGTRYCLASAQGMNFSASARLNGRTSVCSSAHADSPRCA
jgi:hypothetical protein